MYIYLILLLFYVYYMYFEKYYIKLNLYYKLLEYEKRENKKIIIIIDEEWKDKDIIIDNKLSNHIIFLNDNIKFMDVISNIKNNDNIDIDIIIHSLGGDISSSDSIVNILLTYDGLINTYIPYYAMSAGSLIALCGNQIYMDRHSQLGPVDPQISVSLEGDSNEEYIPAKTLIDMNKEGNLNNNNLIINYYDGKLLYDDGIRTVKNILFKKYKRRAIKTITDEFCSGKYPHSKPFNIIELENMGLLINTNINQKIKEISNLLIKYLDNKII